MKHFYKLFSISFLFSVLSSNAFGMKNLEVPNSLSNLNKAEIDSEPKNLPSFLVQEEKKSNSAQFNGDFNLDAGNLDFDDARKQAAQKNQVLDQSSLLDESWLDQPSRFMQSASSRPMVVPANSDQSSDKQLIKDLDLYLKLTDSLEVLRQASDLSADLYEITSDPQELLVFQSLESIISGRQNSINDLYIKNINKWLDNLNEFLMDKYMEGGAGLETIDNSDMKLFIDILRNELDEYSDEDILKSTGKIKNVINSLKKIKYSNPEDDMMVRFAESIVKKDQWIYLVKHYRQNQ
jgi:hypothetical protein